MKKRCIIIGASPEADLSFLPRCLHDDDFIVCADGGYHYAEALGIKTHLIIGDFDSSKKPELSETEIISLPVKKDDTDTHYAVKECIKRGFDEFILCAVSGGRADHNFACYSTLKYLSDNGKQGCICDGDNVVRILGKGKYQYNIKISKGIGIFPFGCESCTVTLKGFEYEAEKLELLSSIPMGCSNCVTNEEQYIEILSGTAILFEY